ncbi:hypothetical protein PTKIN_Ptkin03bG0152200 [Pterospermum kingtungense]
MHKHSPSKLQNIDVDDDHEEEVWGGRGCDWFSLFCLKWPRNDIDETEDTLLQRRGEKAETLWKRKLKKLKEVSEKLAGPKWKNFIRKMSGYCNKKKTQTKRFQYDPYSYALNFDNGDADKEGHGYLLHDFSSRLADDRQRAGSAM